MEKCVVIMAGGKGSRFWPISRVSKPKQFLKIIDDKKTMIQLTVERALRITDASNIYVVTSYEYEDLINEQLEGIPKENILYEPQPKNTAPCIAYACAKIKSKYDDAIMVVLSADHLVKYLDIFVDTVNIAIENSCLEDKITTIGIVPTSPETGYGYIKYKHIDNNNNPFVYKVESFVEKPNLTKAREYLTSGKYLWNSGMFVWKVSTIVKNFEKYLPNTYSAYNKLVSYFNDESKEKLISIYSSMDSVSIDYGILEKCEDVYAVLGNFGWDDVGNWLAIERVKQTDDNHNYFNGEVLSQNSVNSTVISNNKPIAAIGIKDLIVVDTDDVLFLCSKENTQFINEFTKGFQNTKYEKLL